MTYSSLTPRWSIGGGFALLLMYGAYRYWRIMHPNEGIWLYVHTTWLAVFFVFRYIIALDCSTSHYWIGLHSSVLAANPQTVLVAWQGLTSVVQEFGSEGA